MSNVHENVILDLLPTVRSGHASAESRALVEEYLKGNPQLATYAALMPTPDAQLEMRALERTRREVGRNGWTKGLAIFFTMLPFSFMVDDQMGFHFLFAKEPAIMGFMMVAAVVFWALTVHYNRRWSALK